MVEYALAGVDREIVFEIRNGLVDDVRLQDASFTSLAHASQHGMGGRPSLLRIGAKGITDKIRPYHTDAVRERYQARFDAAFKHRVSGLGGAVGLRRSFVGDAVEIDRQLGERVRHLATLAVAPHPSREGRGARDRLSDGSAWKTAHDAYVAARPSVLGREVDPDKPEEELEAAFEGLLTKHSGTSPSDVAKIRRIIELSREWSASLASSHRNFEEFLAKTRTIVTATCVGAGRPRHRSAIPHGFRARRVRDGSAVGLGASRERASLGRCGEENGRTMV